MKFALIISGVAMMAIFFEAFPSYIFMPLGYMIFFHWMALMMAIIAVIITLLRAYSTGAYYLMDMPDPGKVLWFLFRKGGNIRIIPSRRLASFPFLYNKKMKRYIEETGKSFHCAGHPAVPVIEGIDHIVHPKMVAGINKVAEVMGIDASDYKSFRNKLLERLGQAEGVTDEQRKVLNSLYVPDNKKEMELMEWIKQNPLPENLITVEVAGEPFDPSDFEKYFTNVMSQTNFESMLNLQEAVIIERDKTYKPASFSTNTMMWALILAFAGAILLYSVYSLFG